MTDVLFALRIASCVLLFFFFTKRAYTPASATRRVEYTDRCSFGLTRAIQTDTHHSILRQAGSLCLLLQWILILPSAAENLDVNCESIFRWSHIIGMLLVCVGQA